MAHTHPPMDTRALPHLRGWLNARLRGEDPDPEELCVYPEQGAIVGLKVLHDKVDGSALIEMTTQPIRPATRGDPSTPPARPRLRYWDCEAALSIRLSLINGGTLFVDDDRRAEEKGEGWNYPEIYNEGIILNRILMNAQPGERIAQRENLPNVREYPYRDCRLRWLTRKAGSARDKRGRPEFLQAAEGNFLRPNRGQTGEERFGLHAADYLGLLRSTLDLNYHLNATEAPQVA